MTALPSTLIPRVSRLVRMLASPVDGEALNAARALGNTLKSAGFDINDLAETLEQPRKPRAARVSRAARTQPAPPRAPQGSGMVWSLAQRITIARTLRQGIRGALFTEWEIQFATDIIGQITSPSRPRDLTPKQAALVDGLLAKIGGASR